MKQNVFIRTFKVEGKGFFPVDMLRYDSAWPASETDSGLIEETHSAVRVTSIRSAPITLCTIAVYGPTDERWNSFNWRVVPGSLTD